MKVALVAVLAAVLSGCAATVVSSGDRTVVVRAPAGQLADAHRLASSECGKYKRSARLVPTGKSPLVFDCVD